MGLGVLFWASTRECPYELVMVLFWASTRECPYELVMVLFWASTREYPYELANGLVLGIHQGVPLRIG
ncbi:hypothetical protein DXZ20_33305 [Leptolyngbyaceae cyanobacterium CCMR0081]|uniref:Uncharacterized protein n=1 Tax=Adonisia turfae CCMR0081 TaxID=2292702 RepID=A0A6M0RW06_9CYAN|nr:hypothetical protein [Adonisia turfae CCMR0081]